MDSRCFDFILPASSIADRPVSPRDSARMLCLEGDVLLDLHVYDLAKRLKKGDILVLNDTKVIPARLYGKRLRSQEQFSSKTMEDFEGARVEVLLHLKESCGRWMAFIKGSKKVQTGDKIFFALEFYATVVEKKKEEILLDFHRDDASLLQCLHHYGSLPLPPYLKRKNDVHDNDDYQTCYARNEGAIAAPTAGLHFTPRVFQALENNGILWVFVTLHVGAGTFLPMKEGNIYHHRMHPEWGRISEKTAQMLNSVRFKGGRIVCVGTTSVRLLESSMDPGGRFCAFEGWTSIYISPGYVFKSCEGLLTNFHLPRSTLFVLVSAFCGLQTMHRVYQHAIAQGYRFYSYGDSSLLWR